MAVAKAAHTSPATFACHSRKKAYMFAGTTQPFFIIIGGRFVDLITPILGQFDVTRDISYAYYKKISTVPNFLIHYPVKLFEKQVTTSQI